VSAPIPAPDEFGKVLMFQTFVSSHAVRFGAARIGMASFSVLAHATLITFAIVESGPRSSAVATTNVSPTEELHFVRTPDILRNAAAARGGSMVRAAKSAVRLLVPDMTKLQAVAAASLAKVPDAPETPNEIDLTSRISDQRDFGEVDTQALVASSSLWALMHPGRNGAYTQDVVERVAWPQRDNPRPRYPSELQRAGIEGTLLVQFVVDSTGRVDEKTLTFPNDAQPGFLRAVKDALLRSRYFPAELAGMRVRQLVQQQFTFVIAR
jgi:protein TonB